eukprot:2370724-Prymnesium_polylepis.2
MFSPHITDEALEGVLDKPTSRLPQFRYAGPRLHHAGGTALIGDAIHSVKPYFGLGVNAAFEDVAALGQLRALDAGGLLPTMRTAVPHHTARRAITCPWPRAYAVMWPSTRPASRAPIPSAPYPIL